MGETTTTEAARELLRSHAEAWQKFRDAVSRVQGSLQEQTPAGWTAKEMLGHMAFWEEAVEAVVVAMFRGDELREDWGFGSGYVHPEDEPWPFAVVHNKREGDWASSRSTAEVLDRMDRAHIRAVEIFESITPEEWVDERYSSYIREKTGHFDEHRAELEAIAAR